MNVPIEWLREYVPVPDDIKTFTDKMSMIGHMLDKITETEDDAVIDLELRGNRADCYSLIGIARETKASFGGELRIPKITHLLPKKPAPFTVDVKTPMVKRFYSCVIDNISLSSSPDWMQQRLCSYGMEPLNIIVDITNYVMIETGMPLHAFDLDQLGGDQMILRQAEEGETLQTFDGGTLSLSREDGIFSSEDGAPLGLLGIVGGKSSGINDTTTRVLLECAAYDQASIRKSVHRHGVFTEAGVRHTHDIHSSLCEYALERAASLIVELSKQTKPIVQGVNDYYPDKQKEKKIMFHPEETERLGGVSVPMPEQIEALEKLEFRVKPRSESSESALEVIVPLFRTDIFEEADLVEEILRIWGYEKIPSKTLSSVIPQPINPEEISVEEKTRDILTAQGFDEVITVPLVHESIFDKTRDPLTEYAVPVINPPTSNHTHLRTNLFGEEAAIIEKMLHQGKKEVSIFEIGKVYRKKETVFHQPPHTPEFPYAEFTQVSILAMSTESRWDYYDMKGVVENLLSQLLICEVTFAQDVTFPFEVSAKVSQGKTTLGWVGIVDRRTVRELTNRDEQFFAAVLDISTLTKATKTDPDYLPFSQYPAVNMDLSVIVDFNTESTDISQTIREVGKPLVREVAITDVFEMKDNRRSLLYSITYQSKEKTLQSEDVEKVQAKIVTKLKTKHGATVRGKEIKK